MKIKMALVLIILLGVTEVSFADGWNWFSADAYSAAKAEAACNYKMNVYYQRCKDKKGDWSSWNIGCWHHRDWQDSSGRWITRFANAYICN